MKMPTNHPLMAEKQKIYELLKDTIGSIGGHNFIVKCGENLSLMEKTKQYRSQYISKSGWCFDKKFVESNPDWFREIKSEESDQPKEFQWNDSLICELIYKEYGDSGAKKIVENFKQSKQSTKPERIIEVMIYKYSTGYSLLSIGKDVSDQELSQIKEAIEKILSNNTVFDEKMINDRIKYLNDLKEKTIGFAEWLDGQGYECTLHDDENVKHWERYREGDFFTTEQLFDKYLKSINQ